MRILFSGGGSGGSVTPLLAVYEALRERSSELSVLWIGTKKGPERPLVESYGIPYRPVSAGKFRRYFSVLNFIDPFRACVGFVQSFFALRSFKPDAVLTSGSFVAVPVALAARVLRVPVFVHQQDIELGLANKIMARIANVITVTFEQQQESFPFAKVRHTGNPVRARIRTGTREGATKRTGLDLALPTLLILGGGQGAAGINQLVLESLGALCERMNVIHVTGAGKEIASRLTDYYDRAQRHRIEERYRGYPFLTDELPDIFAAATLVVTRAGMSTLSELAVLGKPMVIVPMPDSHQEANALMFQRHNAARVYAQRELTPANFTEQLVDLVDTASDLQQLGTNATTLMRGDAAERYAQLVTDIVQLREK